MEIGKELSLSLKKISRKTFSKTIMNIKGKYLMKSENGAGIITYLDNRDKSIEGLDSKILYLVLVDYKNEYDFPKGSFSHGQDKTSFDCAKRETYEEINLQYEDFENINIDSFTHKSKEKSLTMFLGKIKKNSLANLKIKRNEETGDLEHSRFYWLPYEEIIKNNIRNKKNAIKLKDYLVSSLNWANDKINF